MHTQKPPFNNPDLRRAVNLAIDRQELVAKALEGAGVPCAVLDPKLAGRLRPAARRGQQAARLPRSPRTRTSPKPSGWWRSTTRTAWTSRWPCRSVGNYVDRAQLVLSQLRKIGIRGTIKTYESAAGFAVYGKGDFMFIAAQDRAMVTADPGDLFSLIFTTTRGSNWGNWSDTRSTS